MGLIAKGAPSESDCKCCCMALNKLRHFVAFADLKAFTCSAPSCEELIVAKSIANTMVPSFRGGVPPTTPPYSLLDSLTQAFQISKTTTSTAADLRKLSYITYFANDLSYSSSNFMRSPEYKLASTEVLAELRAEINQHPTGNVFASLANMLESQGLNKGAEAAREAATKAGGGSLSKDSLTSPQIKNTLDEIDQAIARSAALNSTRRIRSNLYEITATISAPHGDYVFTARPDCPELFDSAMKNAIAEIKKNHFKIPRDYAGPLTSVTGQYVLPEMSATAGGDIAAILQPERHAQCVVVAAVLPKGSKDITFNYSAREPGQEFTQCTLANDWWPCETGWAAWNQPVIVETEDAIFVVSTFSNWSHNRTRQANVKIEFRAPSNWSIPDSTELLKH